jgi:hypothetical protein
MDKKIWGVYLGKDNHQSISSAKTARKQVPRTFKFIKNSALSTDSNVLLDIGCGIGNLDFKGQVETLGILYNGCDPFNQSSKENLKSINNCMDGKADYVTLNNVLNTIKEENIWQGILEQAKNALNPLTGVLFILIYEGGKLSHEKKNAEDTGKKIILDPIQTRDGWQNRMKTESYLSFIKNIFSNSEIINLNGVKLIVSSPSIDLNLQKKIKG